MLFQCKICRSDTMFRGLEPCDSVGDQSLLVSSYLYYNYRWILKFIGLFCIKHY